MENKPTNGRFNFCAVLVLFVLAAFVVERAPAAETRLADQLVGPWQLFIDDYLVASKTNVVRRYHPFRKHPDNPLIVVDKPWERDVVACFSVLENEDRSGYRMYYSCWTAKDDPSGRDAVRFRFLLDHARLYSFMAGDNARAVEEQTAPVLQALFTFDGDAEAFADTLGDDGKYHHLAVTYDDGRVNFYLDGKPAGEEWIPGGDPVRLARDLLIGEDADLGSDEQLMGHVDDVLVLGRVLGRQDIVALAQKGAAVFFGLKE
ncbi:MAG TPA: LamG domain-containing protein [Phycisphaerae bacterium]|nr:LamG domain-containing protein [Phycisphaerae bacterium]